MASHFKAFSEDGILVINEAIMQRNTRKGTNLGLSVFIVNKDILYIVKKVPAK